MRKITIVPGGCPREVKRAVGEILAARRNRGEGRGAVRLRFVRESGKGSRLSVAGKGREMEIRYRRTTDALRALGRILGGEDSFEESCRFEKLGCMVDVSRNGVLTVEAAKDLIRRTALMGLNMMMLYAEDTYEVPGEPFFGYLRGAYSADELKELDRYAALFGIEMLPCIQTLAHLEQILQWPAYSEMRDTGGVLIAGEEKTYALIERMIRAASAPFRSKRIHLGMDEAHGIGSGNYRRKHGEKRPFDILNDHLARVRDICRKLGLKPMIWSDMYFRLGSASDSYYDGKTKVPREIIDRIPKDVEFVYWDYYSHDQAHYAEWIERHRMLGHEPIMAGGVWTWNHFWAAYPFSLKAVEACMKACGEKGLREVFMTMWGDDGMECDVYSALAGLQLFAEHGYAQKAIDGRSLRANFRGSCEADYDDWTAGGLIDAVDCLADPSASSANVSKWLLWQDPALAVMDPQLGKASLRKHYEKAARRLASAARKKGMASRLAFPAQLARVLALKCDLRREMAGAVRSRSRSAAGRVLRSRLLPLRRELGRLWRLHRSVWHSLYKPFGWEVVERRYGGLMARVETLTERLGAFASGELKSIPELEAKLLQVFPGDARKLPGSGYMRVATPSCIK